MRALVQRVSQAAVTVDGKTVGSIGHGLLVLLGVHRVSTDADAVWLARKVGGLRIFRDADGRMNRSVVDAGGEALVVSQFTLYGDARRGTRPSFVEAAAPDVAEALYLLFVQELAEVVGRPVPTGIFGAMMEVASVNDGPVTLMVERRAGES